MEASGAKVTNALQENILQKQFLPINEIQYLENNMYLQFKYLSNIYNKSINIYIYTLQKYVIL